MNRICRAIIAAALVVPGLAALVQQPASATPSAGPITKLAVYMMENTSQAAAYAGMPYLSSLASQYGKATDYTGVTHPSEGNYVTIVSGQGAGTCGMPDPQPTQCPQPGSTVLGQAIGAGHSAKLYQDGMDANCSASGDYGHNPWLFFTAEASLCSQFDVPMGTTSAGNLASDITSGTLPTLSMIVPSDSNNGHSGTLSTADSYLQGWMTKILSGPDWNSGHLAVAITFDEGTTTEDVAFVVVSPTVASGTTFSSKADHNSLERLYAEVAGVPPMNGGTTATDLAAPFGITAGTTPTPTTTTTTAPASTTTTPSTSPTTSPSSSPSTTAPSPTTTAPPPADPPAATLHYTSNESDFTAPAAVGFNVHDTGTDQATIDSLPNGGKALVWLGEKCPSGASSTFTSAIDSLGRDSHVFGYYLSDEPDPGACPQGPANVAAESDYIHAHAPGQRSFVVVDDTPGAWAAYAPAHSHRDLVGLDPYPCRTNTNGCDLSMIDSAVTSAEAAGIASNIIVPVFQTFGGSPAWVMPTPQQLQAILAEWAKLIPAPVLDYAYSWGCQGGSLSDCLQNHPEAQTVMQAHNAAAPSPSPSPPPTSSTTAPPSTGTTAPGAGSTTTTSGSTSTTPTSAPPTRTGPVTTTTSTTADPTSPAEPPNTTTTVESKGTSTKEAEAGHGKHHGRDKPSRDRRRRHRRAGTRHQEAVWLEPARLKAYFQGDWYEAMRLAARAGTD